VVGKRLGMEGLRFCDLDGAKSGEGGRGKGGVGEGLNAAGREILGAGSERNEFGVAGRGGGDR
jgi:hypothetical protein